MVVRHFADESSWVAAALGEFRAAVEDARADGRSSLSLCLAGGSTPEVVYRAMAAMPLEDLAVDLWLGDERVVAPDDCARNGVMIGRAFADCAWTPAPVLHLWPALVPAPANGPVSPAALEKAAAEYAGDLSLSRPTPCLRSRPPRHRRRRAYGEPFPSVAPLERLRSRVGSRFSRPLSTPALRSLDAHPERTLRRQANRLPRPWRGKGGGRRPRR